MQYSVGDTVKYLCGADNKKYPEENWRNFKRYWGLLAEQDVPEYVTAFIFRIDTGVTFGVYLLPINDRDECNTWGTTREFLVPAIIETKQQLEELLSRELDLHVHK